MKVRERDGKDADRRRARYKNHDTAETGSVRIIQPDLGYSVRLHTTVDLRLRLHNQTPAGTELWYINHFELRKEHYYPVTTSLFQQ